MKRLALLFIALIFAGCSSDDDASVTAPTTVTGALTNINTQVGNLVPATNSLSATSVLKQRVAMTTEWTTTGNTYSHGGDFGASPRDYVRIHGDNTANSSLMYRLKQIIDNICLFTTALPDADNDGTPDITTASTTTLSAAVKADLSSTCGVDVSELPPDDTVVGFQVEDISGNTGSQYDGKVSFDLTGGTSFTDFFYFRLNASVNRVAYVEDGSNDSAAFFQFDVATGVFSFEFSEDATSNFLSHYRGVLETTTNLGRFSAVVIRNNDTSTAVVSVQEGGGDELHVSYSFDDDADSNDFADGSACIAAADFSIATDNSESCNSGAITGVLASASTFDVATNINGTNILATDETSVINFSDLTTILTADSAD
ncbi:MAG: hypothetical protein AAF203_02145 [Pseudomonadota bacterium]